MLSIAMRWLHTSPIEPQAKGTQNHKQLCLFPVHFSIRRMRNAENGRAMPPSSPTPQPAERMPYMGLSPFLRLNIAGGDLNALGVTLLAALAQDPYNANLLMNMSLLSQSLGQQDIGLEFQREALKFSTTYRLPATQQPTRLRLLLLVTSGNLQVNTPLECLLEDSDIELLFYYVSDGQTSLAQVPEHDALFVAICESDHHRALLQALEQELRNWPTPVINPPQCIPRTGRQAASALLQNVPRLLVPATVRVARTDLQAIANGRTHMRSLLAGHDFPVIIRPISSQAGKDLCKVSGPGDIVDYLGAVDALEQAFYVAPFVDYSDAHGQFKKIRMALVDGQAFVCHMAVSSNWMVHYLNAGMYEQADKRQQEAAFMDHFGEFTARHRHAIGEIARRMQLGYLVLDCAETRAGELLLFEIDHGGVVHNMDLPSLFPYKARHIHSVQSAFRDYLVHLVSNTPFVHAAHRMPSGVSP